MSATITVAQSAATTAPVLEACDLARSYGRGTDRVAALRRANLTVAPGELVGIQGPSGSGKSTLLRLLAGTEVPDRGTVTLAGRHHVGDRDRRPPRPTGQVMPILQDPTGSLDPRWPVWRSITEPLTARHRSYAPSRAKRRQLTSERLGRVGLEHVDPDARPTELSRGQCQRVAILRALIADPIVLLCDEPTSALDASVSAGILHLLVEVAARGTAVIVVSHDRPLVDVLCGRILTLTDGLLEEAV